MTTDTASEPMLTSQSRLKGFKIAFGTSALLIIAAAVSLCVGRYPIQLQTVLDTLLALLHGESLSDGTIEQRIVLNVRLPRVILSALTGAGLAICGATLQSLFRNPLVSPRVLGLSSGAALGGAVTLLLGASGFWLVGATFASAFAALLLVAMIARIAGNTLLTVVLAGIVIDAFFSALISLAQYVADPETSLPAIVFWLMGSFTSASWSRLQQSAPFVFAGIILLHMLRFRIAVLSLGDEDARSFGLNVNRDRWSIFVIVSMIIGACVSIGGVIGWVGLVVPHAVRMLIGEDHRYFLGMTAMLGACYMMFIDTLARVLTTAEIPLGVLTAIIGAPVFVYLLYRRRKIEASL